MNGTNLFGVNMNMLDIANLCSMGISPEAQLLVAQISAAGGGFGQPGPGAGLGALGGLQGGIVLRNGPGRSLGCSSGFGGSGFSGKGGGAAGNGGAKDEEDFDPAVLHDVARCMSARQLHKYTPNVEGISWKDIVVVMDEQALEAQVSAAGICS